jgi:hypothetical protein
MIGHIGECAKVFRHPHEMKWSIVVLVLFLAAISVRSVCTAAASPFHAEPKHRDVCATFVPNSCDWNNPKNSCSFNQELLRIMVTGLHFCAAQKQRL